MVHDVKEGKGAISPAKDTALACRKETKGQGITPEENKNGVEIELGIVNEAIVICFKFLVMALDGLDTCIAS